MISKSNAEGKAKAGKPKNSVGSTSVKLTIPIGLVAQLERISATHMYGKNYCETAAQILAAEVRRLLISGELDTLLANRPIDGPDEDSTESDSEE